MSENSVPRLSKAPFLVGDLLLLAAAAWLTIRGPAALDVWKSLIVVVAVGAGAWLAIMPFLLQFRAELALLETARLENATAQLGNLEELARQIASAGAEWQRIHQGTVETVSSADLVAEKMIAESRSFGEVLTRINDVEKNHLRLEAEKLRRAEAEWLQVIVRLFDHIHALHQAAVHSGHQNVAAQITQFQNACRDLARRIGFVSIVPPEGVPFDEKQHQLLEGQEKREGMVVAAIVGPGYTFQGQLLRLPVVTLGNAAPDSSAEEPNPQLSFEDVPKAEGTNT